MVFQCKPLKLKLLWPTPRTRKMEPKKGTLDLEKHVQTMNFGFHVNFRWYHLRNVFLNSFSKFILERSSLLMEFLIISSAWDDGKINLNLKKPQICQTMNQSDWSNCWHVCFIAFKTILVREHANDNSAVELFSDGENVTHKQG